MAYDITNADSFSHVSQWVDDVKRYAGRWGEREGEGERGGERERERREEGEGEEREGEGGILSSSHRFFPQLFLDHVQYVQAD